MCPCTAPSKILHNSSNISSTLSNILLTPSTTVICKPITAHETCAVMPWPWTPDLHCPCPLRVVDCIVEPLLLVICWHYPAKAR